MADDDLGLDDDTIGGDGRKVPKTDNAKKKDGGSDAHGVARDQLRAFVERIERLEEEKTTLVGDIKDVYGEAKAMGYDTKILKRVVALRKKDDDERREEELILDTYLQALGMLVLNSMDDD